MYKIRSVNSLANNSILQNEILRRYSDFEEFFKQLWSHYPGLILPQLPETGVLAKIDLGYIQSLQKQRDSFLEERRVSLQEFIEYIVHHPEIRYAPELKGFLINSDFPDKKKQWFNIFNEAQSKGIFSDLFGGSQQRKPDEIDEKDSEYEQFLKV